MATPYTDPLETIRDIDKYFEINPKTHRMVFTGDTLEVRTPQRFDVYGLLDISDVVLCVGIMDLIIDGKYRASLNLLAQIQVEPTEITNLTYQGIPYLVMHLKHGDTFIANTNVVKNPKIIYAVCMEFIIRGKPPYNYNYAMLGSVFEQVKKMTGSGVGVDHSLYELVITHLSRSEQSLFDQYRYTDMSKPPRIIPLRSVTHALDSTTSRITGSRFDDGLTPALLHESTEHKPFEDLLRGLPTKPGNPL